MNSLWPAIPMYLTAILCEYLLRMCLKPREIALEPFVLNSSLV